MTEWHNMQIVQLSKDSYFWTDIMHTTQNNAAQLRNTQ